MTQDLLPCLVVLTERPEHEMAVWTDPLMATMLTFGITTPPLMAAFLANVVHESAKFKRLEENLDYTAQRLAAVWPHRFHLAQDDPETGRQNADRFAHHPELIANSVYAGRLGNGDEASGDGWRFRGRGLMQLTGREQYQAFFDALPGILLRVIDATGNPIYRQVHDALLATPGLWPDLLIEPDLAALSAGWYWERIGANALIRSDSPEAFEELTRAINGQLIGLESRLALWAQARSVLAQA
jgi:putative chitinase